MVRHYSHSLLFFNFRTGRNLKRGKEVLGGYTRKRFCSRRKGTSGRSIRKNDYNLSAKTTTFFFFQSSTTENKTENKIKMALKSQVTAAFQTPFKPANDFVINNLARLSKKKPIQSGKYSMHAPHCRQQARRVTTSTTIITCGRLPKIGWTPFLAQK